MSKRRLADEYDAAQDRGEVATGRPKTLPDGNTSATQAEVGLSAKEVHEARQIRDAEEADPGTQGRGSLTHDWLPVAISLVGLVLSVVALVYTRHSAKVARAALDMNLPYVSVRARAATDHFLHFGLAGTNADQWLIHSVAVKSPKDAILMEPIRKQDEYGELIPSDPRPLGRVAAYPSNPLVVPPASSPIVLEFRLALKSDRKTIRSREARQL